MDLYSILLQYTHLVNPLHKKPGERPSKAFYMKKTNKKTGFVSGLPTKPVFFPK